MIPKNCHLWQKEDLSSQDLSLENFELLETFADDSHFWRYLLKCKECGQLYFYEFYEWIDWEEGNDPQYVKFIPVETKYEIETLKKTNIFELLKFSPRLHQDYPQAADKPEVFWVGK